MVFSKSIAMTEQADTLKQRVSNLLETATFFVFMYTNRALFEADKLIFKAQMAIQILLGKSDIGLFLLNCPNNFCFDSSR